MELTELFVVLIFASLGYSSLTTNVTRSNYSLVVKTANLGTAGDLKNKAANNTDEKLKGSTTDHSKSKTHRGDGGKDAFAFESKQIPMMFPETHLDVTKRDANETVEGNINAGTNGAGSGK